jgi:hypothetical protein
MFKNDCNREFIYCLKNTITTKKSQVYPSVIFQNYEYISIPKIHVKVIISLRRGLIFQRCFSRTMIANSLYKQVYFPGFISFWKFYLGHFNLKAIGLPTL